MAKRTFSPRPCTKCGVIKGVDGFYASARHADGFTRQCRSCQVAKSSARARNVRAANGRWPSQDSPSREPEIRTVYDRARYAATRDKALAKNRKHRYGVTADEVEALLSKQCERCAICEAAITVRSACVDHCHSTGRVRGLLCRNCNFGLGHFRDDPARLTSALAYLSA